MKKQYKRPRYIKRGSATYHRALETNKFIFYINFKESDENASVIMLDRKRQLISDNYFAYEALMDELNNRDEIKWISDELKEQVF